MTDLRRTFHAASLGTSSQVSSFSAKPMARRQAGTPGTPPAFFWKVAFAFFRLRYFASWGLLEDRSSIKHGLRSEPPPAVHTSSTMHARGSYGRRAQVLETYPVMLVTMVSSVRRAVPATSGVLPLVRMPLMAARSTTR